MMLCGLLAGCAAPTAAVVTPTPAATAALTPYPSATLTPRPSPTSADTPTPLPSPTPTPRTHVLQNGQDLFGLSLYYKVPLADILALNPGINPNAMGVGTVIIIPPESVQAGAQPSATPAPLQLDAPVCWPTSDGSALCFVLARNPLEVRIEAVSAVVRVQGGGEVISQNAYLPLDGIPAGATLPLVARFTGPLSAPILASAELQTAIPLTGSDERHLPLQSPAPTIAISPDGLLAEIDGQLILAQGSQPASRAWLLAVAYDAQNRPVGVRRWENLSPLAPGEPAAYALTVYSAAGAIARVEVFAEALP